MDHGSSLGGPGAAPCAPSPPGALEQSRARFIRRAPRTADTSLGYPGPTIQSHAGNASTMTTGMYDFAFGVSPRCTPVRILIF